MSSQQRVTDFWSLRRRGKIRSQTLLNFRFKVVLFMHGIHRILSVFRDRFFWISLLKKWEIFSYPFKQPQLRGAICSYDRIRCIINRVVKALRMSSLSPWLSNIHDSYVLWTLPTLTLRSSWDVIHPTSTRSRTRRRFIRRETKSVGSLTSNKETFSVVVQFETSLIDARPMQQSSPSLEYFARSCVCPTWKTAKQSLSWPISLYL
jgi:hypothetical protein